MNSNMGSNDRTLRLLAASIVAPHVTQQITGTLAVVSALVAVLLVGPSIGGDCPLYATRGLSTRKHVAVPAPTA
jgi:hypothetical protein